jgi:hypothetical protein
MRKRIVASFALLAFLTQAVHAAPVNEQCRVVTGTRVTPVIELFTSEGCNSCPPADRWLSQLAEVREGRAVALAFHVDYWDYIGWKDRFASPQFTARQYEGAATRNSRQVYTPQVVVNGQDFRWASRSLSDYTASTAPAKVQIELSATPQGDSLQLQAKITPLAGAPARLAAYWAVTEDAHVSKVTAGENARETLKHDYVVRQYLPVAAFNSSDLSTLQYIVKGVNSQTAALHPQRVHLIVTDAHSGAPIQAAALLRCL